MIPNQMAQLLKIFTNYGKLIIKFENTSPKKIFFGQNSFFFNGTTPMEIPARRDACNANASQRQRRTESRRFAHPDINVYLNSLLKLRLYLL